MPQKQDEPRLPERGAPHPPPLRPDGGRLRPRLDPPDEKENDPDGDPLPDDDDEHEEKPK